MTETLGDDDDGGRQARAEEKMMSRDGLRRTLALVGVLVGTVVLHAAGVSAQEAPEGPKTHFSDTPCAEDFVTFCKGVPGWRQGFVCLQTNAAAGKLSDACSAHTVEVAARKKKRVSDWELAWRTACAADIEANCGQFESSVSISGCLNQLREEIADACDELLPRRPGYKGPGHIGWKDGSEPADYDEQLRKRLKPRHGNAIPGAMGGGKLVPVTEAIAAEEAAAEAKRQEIRAAVRARLETNRKAREAAAQAQDAAPAAE